MKKYAIHPGPVKSQFDGQTHHVSFGQLLRLYELHAGDSVIFWDEYTARGRKWNDYVHLYPREDGNYGRPNV